MAEKSRDENRMTHLPSEAVVRAVHADRSVARHIRAEAGNCRTMCWLRLGYSARNPLVVTIAMCAPSRAVVFERAVTRADVREALQRRISYPDLIIYPDSLRGRTLFRFCDRQLAVNVGVLTPDVAAFVRDTEGVVPISRELDAVNAALEIVMSDRLSPQNG